MLGFFSLLKVLLRIDNRLIALNGLMQLIVENQGLTLQVSPADHWLDNQDVMQKLNISASTLKRRRLDGIIPCTRIKGKCFYKESDIQLAMRKGYDGEV